MNTVSAAEAEQILRELMLAEDEAEKVCKAAGHPCPVYWARGEKIDLRSAIALALTEGIPVPSGYIDAAREAASKLRKQAAALRRLTELDAASRVPARRYRGARPRRRRALLTAYA